MRYKYLLPLRKKVVVEKRIGETPLQTILRFKTIHPRYSHLPATYAGRLDPMASGKLLLLFGEECKKKDKYLGLDKEYVLEVLLGIGSDTGDILGVESSGAEVSLPTQEEIKSVLSKEIGTFIRPYPLYSSKTVDGKPLFLYALDETVNTIDIPTHKETIFSISLLGITTITTSLLRTHITNTLSLAPISVEKSKKRGEDFRIESVRKSWERALTSDRTYGVLKLKVRCGSGAYMRTLAERIGEALGTSALALSIHRTHIGKRNILW